MQLHKRVCIPCKEGTPPLSRKDVREFMEKINGWRTDYKKIWKEYKFHDDRKALRFLFRIGIISMHQGHHPIAEWMYNRVKITFYTHSINGLSANDFIMAAKFDRAVKE